MKNHQVSALKYKFNYEFICFVNNLTCILVVKSNYATFSRVSRLMVLLLVSSANLLPICRLPPHVERGIYNNNRRVQGAEVEFITFELYCSRGTKWQHFFAQQRFDHKICLRRNCPRDNNRKVLRSDKKSLRTGQSRSNYKIIVSNFLCGLFRI